MAGNVWEYTTEQGKLYSTKSPIGRGGEYRDSIINSAAFRNLLTDKAQPGVGFRVVLYK